VLVKSRILQKVNTLVFGIINEVVQVLLQYACVNAPTDTVGVLFYVVLYYILTIVTFLIILRSIVHMLYTMEVALPPRPSSTQRRLTQP
jgi:hypothetical protein